MKKIIIGSNGQIGTELRQKLIIKYGKANVLAADIFRKDDEIDDDHFFLLDATDTGAVKEIFEENEIDDVYLMAAILSARGEQMPRKAWDINMRVLLNLLEIGKEGLFSKLFWPSSIAVFGPNTPKEHTHQYTVMDPNTVYGISKLAGERWMEYFFEKYGLDTRSIRYPGIISWKAAPGGGTTDYAIEMFDYALRNETYKCYIAPDERLPMMYIDDAIDATIHIMEAPSENLTIRSSYNLAAVNFTPKELEEAIKRYIPEFKVIYKPDFRNNIAKTWPDSIDDRFARKDWNWQHRFDLDEMVKAMLSGLQKSRYPELTLNF